MDERVHTFPNGIYPLNIKARLELELAYYSLTVQHANHYVRNIYQLIKCIKNSYLKL